MKKMRNRLVIIGDTSPKRIMFLFGFGLSSLILSAQDAQEELKEAQEFLSEASVALQEDKFSIAEADYRKAISLNPADEKGKYNLGTAYYGKSKNTEALNRFKQAASVATEKLEKHRAFHNLGNSFMNEKNYTEAVEAFKNALRNNPTDDESRYNLALAKDMLEKNPPQDDKGDDDNKEKDDKKEDDKKKEDSEDKKGDDGDPKEDQDKGDQKEDKKEGEDEKDKGKPNEPEDKQGDKQPQKQKPQPGQLSPQQVKSLLEAMNNEEKEVQKKMNARKQKGAKVKSNKDW